MIGTGVVAALGAEARTLGAMTRRRDGLWAARDGTLVCVSGMGVRAAAAAADSLVEAGARALVSWGMAGALDPQLMAGTVCLPDAVLREDRTAFATDPFWREHILAALKPFPVVGGTLLTVRTAIADVSGKASAFRASGSVAVDMESSAVAERAARSQMPFLTVRVIVDTAADRVPAAVAAASDGGRLSLLRLCAGLARAPTDLAAVCRLALRYRAAIGALHAVAAAAALGRQRSSMTPGAHVA